MDDDAHFPYPPAIVFVLESNPLLRASLRAWLHQEFPHCQVEASASLDLAEPKLLASPPQVALVDIDPWHGEGLANLRALRARLPAATLVALTIHQPGFLHEQAIRAGASACACIALSDDSLRDLLRSLLAAHVAQRA